MDDVARFVDLVGPARLGSLLQKDLDHDDVEIDLREHVGAPSNSEPSLALRTWLVLSGILAVATFVRVWQLNRVGFNSDETVYAGQAASIAGRSTLEPFFPIFRAHPLLFQSILSIVYQFTTSDFLARLVSVAFGVGTVAVVFALGRLLYGRRAGFIAAGILALMPYHVVVTRQVLLDGPMVFFATLTLYALARYAITEQARWMYATAACMGLTFLAKETGIVLLVAVCAFLVLAPQIRTRPPRLAISFVLLISLIALYPLTTALSGASKTGKSFLAWQIFRSPNHSALFYFETVPFALGVFVLAAALGNWFLRREGSWRETLLVVWVVAPICFFELWPVKGFQYLLPIAPAIAVLAARVLARLPLTGRTRGGRVSLPWAGVTFVVAIAILVSLAVSTVNRIDPPSSGTFLAGSGGVAGGREAGRWVDAHVPRNAHLLALGPSMANILEFYGNRQAYGLSVSTNPLHRNPVYQPVANPDLLIRHGDLQYLVWDSYSARRSPTFAAKLLAFAKKYHGRVVHSETIATGTAGSQRRQLITIYAVRP